jgi:hypothetical protein
MILLDNCRERVHDIFILRQSGCYFSLRSRPLFFENLTQGASFGEGFVRAKVDKYTVLRIHWSYV